MDVGEDESKSQRASTAYSRWLGEELRQLRGARKPAAIAARLGWSISRLAKLENGSRGTADVELGALLGLYGADAATRERLVRMSRDPRPDGFVCVHADRPADDVLPLVLHERLAVAISHYSPLVVPAPLQSEDYARAVLAGRRQAGAPEAALTARIDRRSRVEGTPAEFFVDEWTLTPRGHDPGVLADQVMYLRLVANAPTTSVRVVPAGTAVAPAVDHPFSIFTLERPLRSVVCVEMHAVTGFVERDSGVETYARLRDLLAGAALSPEGSRRFLEEVSDWYERGGTTPWPGAAVLGRPAA
ncbi:helix-turn-helix domain-containing protein [Saccharothrix lopnurensis]|uniref:Helix-turn-helix domain-containing protein n=1 Tax=Saccharothrix lopnurensis TaxID=1670621 RepID=A0ABW1P733_9PSEU